MTVRFDDAWTAAQAVGRTLAESGWKTIVLRDMIGRVSLVVDDRHQELAEERANELAARLKEGAGRFAASATVLRASEMFAPDTVFQDQSVVWSDEARMFGRLERGVVGGEWTQVTTAPPSRRVTLYGFKGGVGRSTATFMLARHLAEQGRCVLVIDLDLESPGVGPLLEDQDRYPPFGIVDQLVEAAVGNDDGLEIVRRSTRIRGRGNGEVWLAPSGGLPRAGYDYLAKLNRAYSGVQLDGGVGVGFAQRLSDAVTACEEQVSRWSRSPDVVLLDSRAGLHDIAAVALTQLADLNLLFAADNRQTWSGYGMLFTQWRDAGRATVIRDRLKIIAALVPADASGYLQSFQDRAQMCFADFLYDNAAAGDGEAYNPAPDDDDAPHYPIPVHFVGELVGLDSDTRGHWHSSELVTAAYRDFLVATTSLILGGTDG